MLPSCVAPSQVHKSGDSLGNWSGDVGQEIAIRWKNSVWMLHRESMSKLSQWPLCAQASSLEPLSSWTQMLQPHRRSLERSGGDPNSTSKGVLLSSILVAVRFLSHVM